MRKAVILFTLATFGGCAGGLQKTHKTAYIAGAVSKNVVEESHKVWSKGLNETADKCDKESTSEAQFNDCLGPYIHNDDVVIALTAYTQLAEVLFKVLSNPEATPEQIKDVSGRLMSAARTLLGLMPDSGGKQKLQSLLGK